VTGEQAVADFESAGHPSKTIGQCERVRCGIDVESNEQLVHIGGRWSVVGGRWSVIGDR